MGIKTKAPKRLKHCPACGSSLYSFIVKDSSWKCAKCHFEYRPGPIRVGSFD